MRSLFSRPLKFILAALLATLLFVPVAELSALEPDTVIAPREDSSVAPAEVAKDTSDALRGPVLLAITVLVAGGAFLLMRRMKNGLGGRLSQSSQGAIEICRTRTIGNRQYLVVVQVEGKRMLLGVGPTFMTNLCELDAEDYSIPYERKSGPEKPVAQPVEKEEKEKSFPFDNLISRINDSLTNPDGGKGGPKAR